MGNLTIQVARDPERSCGVRLANQNATDNPAAAKKCRFQETPDPPLGFIGLFVLPSLATNSA